MNDEQQYGTAVLPYSATRVRITFYALFAFSTIFGSFQLDYDISKDENGWGEYGEHFGSVIFLR